MTKRVFIAGDNNIINTTIKNYCTSKDCLVEQHNNGADALRELVINKYDLIVSSVFLEGIDGVQMITALKHSSTPNSTSPVIMITSGEDIHKLFKEIDRPDYILQKNESTISEFEKIYNNLFEDDVMTRPMDVLYIDDDKFIEKMVKMWTDKEQSVNLDFCSSVEDFKKVVDKKYDVIVSDNLLGDGDVLDILREIKNSPLKGTPVLIYTGSVDKIDQDSINADNKNVVDILEKPFKLKDFLKKLEHIKSSD